VRAEGEALDKTNTSIRCSIPYVIATTIRDEPFLGELVTLNWNIDTAGTHAVLKTASANIDAQNSAAQALGTAVSGLGAVLGNGIVAKALNDYVEQSLAPDLASRREISPGFKEELEGAT
jgi:hypothetical protein